MVFWMVGGSESVSLNQGRLPEGRQDWEVHTTMVSDFTQSGRSCSGVFFWGSVVLAGGWRCWAAFSQECSTPSGLEWLAGLQRTQEALPQGSPTWKDCLRM